MLKKVSSSDDDVISCSLTNSCICVLALMIWVSAVHWFWLLWLCSVMKLDRLQKRFQCSESDFRGALPPTQSVASTTPRGMLSTQPSAPRVCVEVAGVSFKTHNDMHCDLLGKPSSVWWMGKTGWCKEIVESGVLGSSDRWKAVIVVEIDRVYSLCLCWMCYIRPVLITIWSMIPDGFASAVLLSHHRTRRENATHFLSCSNFLQFIVKMKHLAGMSSH